MTTTKPITTQPITTEPITTQPITTPPITTPPITTQPITTPPITAPVTYNTNNDYIISIIQNDPFLNSLFTLDNFNIKWNRETLIETIKEILAYNTDSTIALSPQTKPTPTKRLNTSTPSVKQMNGNVSINIGSQKFNTSNGNVSINKVNSDNTIVTGTDIIFDSGNLSSAAIPIQSIQMSFKAISDRVRYADITNYDPNTDLLYGLIADYFILLLTNKDKLSEKKKKGIIVDNKHQSYEDANEMYKIEYLKIINISVGILLSGYFLYSIL
jgi:hypothetical protein